MHLKRWLAPVVMAVALAACGGDEAAPADDASEGNALATLSGTVVYRERMALPINATINVRLLDVSLMDVPARVLGEDKVSAQGQSVPIPYRIEYDPGLVREGMSYAVRAEIRDAAGALLWTTDTVHPVLTNGAPTDNVEVRVVRVQFRD